MPVSPVRARLRRLARRTVPVALLLRRRPLTSEISANQVAFYLDEIERRADLPGALVEVGCYRGATAAAACQMLRTIGKPADCYLAIDTFSGFPDEHFAADIEIGTPESLRGAFTTNSQVVVERTMRYLGLSEVTVVRGDIVTLDETVLPQPIKVCLLDVDLAVPIEAGLRKLWPLMGDGGIMLVHDCEPGTAWKGALVGYRRFCETAEVAEEYVEGFGVVRT